MKSKIRFNKKGKKFTTELIFKKIGFKVWEVEAFNNPKRLIASNIEQALKIGKQIFKNDYPNGKNIKITKIVYLFDINQKDDKIRLKL